LLAPEIRHERNVILQCVRYIVNNNFFGIEQKAEIIDSDRTAKVDTVPMGEEGPSCGEQKGQLVTSCDDVVVDAQSSVEDKRIGKGESTGNGEPHCERKCDDVVVEDEDIWELGTVNVT
jgi:hypothetical protein